jgi:UDP-N-acetylglucosamine--N-acetylmuramyl-(pentapeptide) pyrophosphoryl-undecaprenol N-acetylglucosamine transferase
MARMLKEEKRVKIILISGTAQSEQIMQSAQAEQLENMTVLAYSDEMPMLLNAADVVVCRGGATTLFENIMTATPGVYIPYPHAANDHQRKNIEYITSRGGGVMLDDAQLNAESLYKAVTGIIFDEKRLKAMSENAKGAAPSDALSRLYNEIEKLL